MLVLLLVLETAGREGDIDSIKQVEVRVSKDAWLCSIHEIWIGDTDTGYRFCI